MTIDRSELQRLYDRAVGDGRRYWADSYVQNLVTAVGEYLAQDDPTVELAYLKATIADLKAGAVIPGQNSEQLQRIRQLHHAMDGGNCAECWAAGGYDGAPEWPCATVQLCDEIESGCKPVTPKAEPQRVQPSREDLARVLAPDRWLDSDPEVYRPDSVSVDEWVRVYSESVEQGREPSLQQADAVLALLDSQPTVVTERASQRVQPSREDAWEALLREIGLGAGLHEPLRTSVIHDGYAALEERLHAHDAGVRAQTLREAAAVARLDRVGGLTWIARAVEAWLNARADHIAAAGHEAEGGAR